MSFGKPVFLLREKKNGEFMRDKCIDRLMEKRSSPLLGFPGPTNDEVEEILNIASQVPDHKRLSPYRFILIKGHDLNIFAEKCARVLRASGAHNIEEKIQKICNYISSAPLIIVVVFSPKDSVTVPLGEQRITAGCCAHMIGIASYLLGFNSYWRTGELAYLQETSRELGLIDGESITGFIYIGTSPPGFVEKIKKSNPTHTTLSSCMDLLKPISIECAKINDIVRICELVNLAYSSNDEFRSWTNESKIVSGNRTSEDRLKDMLGNKGIHIFVAKHQGNIIGTVTIAQENDCFVLSMLAVDPRHQQGGVGKSLISFSEDFITKLSAIRKIKIDVVSTRRELIDFYLRRGFVDTGISYDYPVDLVNAKPYNPNLTVAVFEKQVY